VGGSAAGFSASGDVVRGTCLIRGISSANPSEELRDGSAGLRLGNVPAMPVGERISGLPRKRVILPLAQTCPIWEGADGFLVVAQMTRSKIECGYGWSRSMKVGVPWLLAEVYSFTIWPQTVRFSRRAGQHRRGEDRGGSEPRLGGSDGQDSADDDGAHQETHCFFSFELSLRKRVTGIHICAAIRLRAGWGRRIAQWV